MSEPKVPSSIATAPRCTGGFYFFSWIALLTLSPYIIILNDKQVGIKYPFRVFGMTRPGIERCSPGVLANSLTILPIGWLYVFIYKQDLISNTLEG